SQGITIWSTSLYMINIIKDTKNVSCMKQIGDYVWCGTFNGKIYIYHSSTYSKFSEIITPGPIRYMEISANIMWVCTDDCIVRYDINSLERIEDKIQVKRV